MAKDKEDYEEKLIKLPASEWNTLKGRVEEKRTQNTLGKVNKLLAEEGLGFDVIHDIRTKKLR